MGKRFFGERFNLDDVRDSKPDATIDRRKSISKAEWLVYLKLMEKYQNTEPFKYILYSSEIGEQTVPMVTGK
jgi:hypothetical protein